MTPRIACPACGQSDQVVKVSALYIESLERKKASRADPQLAGEASRGSSAASALLEALDAAARESLSRGLKPPASGKELPIRPVNPDLAVLVFTLAAPFFLFQIHASQPGMLLPMLILLGCFYGFYVWKRKDMLAKFEREKERRSRMEGQVKRGIERWMKLYYCARDEGVFAPGTSQLIPVDELRGRLVDE